MRLPISDFQKGNDFGKKMNELKWMYGSINREDFQEKIAFAEKLLEKYGSGRAFLRSGKGSCLWKKRRNCWIRMKEL